MTRRNLIPGGPLSSILRYLEGDFQIKIRLAPRRAAQTLQRLLEINPF